MATRAGVGVSRHHNPNIAGREAAEQALEKAGIEKPDFVFMFATVGYDQRSSVDMQLLRPEPISLGRAATSS